MPQKLLFTAFLKASIGSKLAIVCLRSSSWRCTFRFSDYPVEKFGRKYFVIGTSSWLGNGNRFLGVAYIITGTIVTVLSIALTFIHNRYGNRRVFALAAAAAHT